MSRTKLAIAALGLAAVAGEMGDLRKRRERYVLADNYGGFRKRRDH